jgi:hypothetical protein
MIKNSQSMKVMKLTVRYAVHQCVRFTAQFQRTLKALGFTALTQNSATRSSQGGENKGSDLRFYLKLVKTSLTNTVLSRLEPFRGSERAASRIARSVAIVIGIALCLPMSHASSGSIDAIQSIKELADYQLTEKQEYCHNQIVYRESRFIRDARNGSHHGYYQGRSKALIDAPDDYQFYWFYHYTMHRYGTDPTNHDVPNYCKSLKHLVTKGWQ